MAKGKKAPEEPRPPADVTASGLDLDRRNANRGTERGRGLLEESLRRLGAGRGILAC